MVETKKKWTEMNNTILIPCKICVEEFGHPEAQPQTLSGKCKYHKELAQIIKGVRNGKYKDKRY